MLNIFIDNITHSLTSRLGRKCKSAFTHCFDFIHNIVGKTVNSQWRQRNTDFFVLTPLIEFCKQRHNLCVVAWTQRRKRHFVITRILTQCSALLIDNFGRFFSYGAINKSCLTKTTATNTSAENLLHRSVVHNFHKRNYEIVGIVAFVHLFHKALMNNRRSVMFRNILFNCAVLVVLNIIKRRHIHALYLCTFNEKLFSWLTLCSALSVKLHNLKVNLFALTYEEKVDKIRNRLGVAGTRSACNYYVFKFFSVTAFNRHTRKPEHIEHICQAKFILESETDKVKIGHRISAFKRIKRNIVFYHLFFHINPWGKNSFAPNVRHSVHKAVKNFHSEMWHTYLIGIGKAEGKSAIYFLFILDYFVEFTADISAGFLNLQK